MSARSHRLDVERIVDAACEIIERDGLAGMSMRKLGAELSVDPMAVYHHVGDKRSLLALVTARTLGGMELPEPTAAWNVRVQRWAMSYWEVVVAHRDLTLAGLSDPTIGAAGMPSTEYLIAAIAASGLPTDLVQPSAYVVVDAVHGAALGVALPGRSDHDISEVRRLFEVGLDTIVSGIAARAG